MNISALYPPGEYLKEMELSKQDQLQKSCRHHWLIDKPNGLFSHGVCKLCGAEREFSNIPPYMAGKSHDKREVLSRIMSRECKIRREIRGKEKVNLGVPG